MVATASCSRRSSRDAPSRSSSRSTGIGVMNTRASTCARAGSSLNGLVPYPRLVRGSAGLPGIGSKPC